MCFASNERFTNVVTTSMTARLCADHRNADAAAAAVVVVAAAVVDDVIVAVPRHARVSRVRARDVAFRARRGCGRGLNGRYKQQHTT